MTHGSFFGSVLVGLAILWSGCSAATSLGQKCLKPQLGFKCTLPEVQQEAESDETDGAYPGQVGVSDRFGEEKLSGTSTEELFSAASSPTAVREPLSMQHPLFVFVVLMSCGSIFGILALFGRRRSQSQPATWSVDGALQPSIDGKSMYAEGRQDSKSLKRDNISDSSTHAEQDTSLRALKEQKCSCSDVSADSSQEMTSETPEDVKEAEFRGRVLRMLEGVCSKNSTDAVTHTDIPVDEVEETVSHSNSTTSWVSNSTEASDVICNDFVAALIKNSMDIVTEADIPVDEVEVAGHSMPCGDIENVVEPTMVLEQNVDSHFAESPPGCCDVAQSSEASEVPHQETDSHSNSRSSWVSNSTDVSDVTYNDFGAALITSVLQEQLDSQSTASSHGSFCTDVVFDKVSDCSGDVLEADRDVLEGDSHAPEVTDEACELVVAAQSEAQTAIKKNLCVDTDAKETLRSRLAEIPSPVRRRPSASFESPSPVRRRPSASFESPSLVRRRRPSASFESPSPVRRHASNTSQPASPVCSHATVIQDNDDLDAIEEAAHDAARDATAELFRQLLGDSAIAETRNKQVDEVTDLYDHSLAGQGPQLPVAASCQTSPMHLEETTTTVDYKSVGSARELKSGVERRQSGAHALDLNPSKQMERTRRNSLGYASRCSLSPPAIIDASAFSPGATEYEEPEAGSTHRLKDFFEKKHICTGNPESLCGQAPTKRSSFAPTFTDFFEKRMSMANSQHVCEQTPSKKTLAELLREDED